MTRIVDTFIALSLLAPMLGFVTGLLYVACTGESSLVATVFAIPAILVSLISLGAAALCSLWAE